MRKVSVVWASGVRRVTWWMGVAVMISSYVVSIPMPLYADTNTWVSGALPALTVGDRANGVASAQCYNTSFNYTSYTLPNGTPSLASRLVSQLVCATYNPLGSYGTNSQYSDDYSFVRPNTTTAFPVLLAGGLSAVTPVPEQPLFFRKDPSQSFYGEFVPRFYASFQTAGTFTKASNELAFQFNSGGVTLKDSAGKAISIHSYAFSRSGEWMVVEAVGLGLIRVNTLTFDMQLFDTIQLGYSAGFRPNMTLAVSDDGNTVIRSGNNASSTMVYDLSGCRPGAFTMNAANTAAVQGCRSRDVYANLRSQLSGFDYLASMHLSSDAQSITAVAERTGALGVIEYFNVTYGVAGYQAPSVDYLALGDSFSSGEGAFSYIQGTDSDSPSNKCHLSNLSYPYLAAQAAGITNFHSVACSGAVTDNYVHAQFNDSDQSNSWLPGYLSQKSYFAMAGKASIVTISMIGNDVGFKDKLAQCISLPDDCFHYREDREMIANEIYGKFNRLVSLYQQIKRDAGNADVKVYVLGYPQLFDASNTLCSLNVPLSREERQMAQGLTSYLDAVIQAAARRAGVQYIDTEDAFDGHRLCQANSDWAANGLVGGNDFFLFGSESFHPNALGQQLLAQALIEQSRNFMAPMPAADSAVAPPFDESPVFQNFIGSAPSLANGDAWKASPLTLVTRATLSNADTVKQNMQMAMSETDQVLPPNVPFQLWLHSTPISAGSLTTDAQGQLHGSITVPTGITPGYHTLEAIGKGVDGQDVHLYQTIYVAASDTDKNGDGVPDAQEQCKVVPDSGVDQDTDGIDDACDPHIASKPADTVPPVVTGIPDRQPDANGWYNHSVTVTWEATDPDPSSGAPTQPPATTADQDGEKDYVSNQACDPADNCATGSVHIKLDQTAPIIHAVVNPVPGSSGWNTGSVTVTFTCDDALSGVDNCPDAVTVRDDGPHTVTGTATDVAGNSAKTNVTVKIDAVPPAITPHISPAPNSSGWNNTDVALVPSCVDSGSGVASCGDARTIATEGANQAAVVRASDIAGNATTTTTVLNIDKTAPTIDSLSWGSNPKALTSTASLTIHASDHLSGVAQAEYFIGDHDPGAGHGAPVFASGDAFIVPFGTDYPTGVYKVSVRVRDAAGNWSDPSSDYLVVYNPFSTRLTGRHTVVPSLAHGDRLPGLITADQRDAATFAFNVGYDARGHLLAGSGFKFAYKTGARCGRPAKAVNCHTLTLTAGAIDWFAVDGTSRSVGTFEGGGTLVVDGVSLPVRFLVRGTDGDRLSPTKPDHFTVHIFRTGDNPAVATPLYTVSDDVARGTIQLRS